MRKYKTEIKFNKESELSNGVRLFLKETCLCQKTYGEALNIDMVGVNNNTLYGVEMKLTLSNTVLHQAKDRLQFCNVVYIAIPYTKQSDHYYNLDEVKRLWLETHGIGLITIRRRLDVLEYNILKHGKLNRSPKYKKNLLNELPKLKEDSEGGLEVKYMITPYKNMIDEIKTYLKRNNEPKTIKEIIIGCPYIRIHYANPEASLYQTLNANYNKDWITREGNKYKIKIIE